MMRFKGLWFFFNVAILTPALAFGQSIQVRVVYPGKVQPARPSAAVWFMPVHPASLANNSSGQSYTLLQKNRSFIPHLLVIPVGSNVEFPNQDNFFHNVFSLFDGKRFDLGLYEAGSTKKVLFSREGVSYIFCNIHPEMSAVIVAVATPYFATINLHGYADLHDVPVGDYELHVWAEGIPQPALNGLTRKVHIAKDETSLESIIMPQIPVRAEPHLNKFGQPYDVPANPSY